MKFGFDWPSGFRGDVLKWLTDDDTDGRRRTDVRQSMGIHEVINQRIQNSLLVKRQNDNTSPGSLVLLTLT